MTNQNDGWGSNWQEHKHKWDTVERYLEPKQIELTLWISDDESVTVKATQIGNLAVHPHLTMWGSWQVSHVPTKVHFMKAVPELKINQKFGSINSIMDYTQEQLINWCKTVQQSLRDDWNVLAQLTEENYNEWSKPVQAAKDRIQAMCRATKI